MTDVEATVQPYYGDRPVMQRIDDALRAAGVDPERPSHRDLWPFDQLHSRGIVATREHAERARLQAGMYVLEVGCGLGGASRYLAAECGCRVAAIDLTPNFVEAARILTARCGLRDRVEIRQANALALPFQDGTFDHVWSYAVTMNIPDKAGLAREVARVLNRAGASPVTRLSRELEEHRYFPCLGRRTRCRVSLSAPRRCAPRLRAVGCLSLSRSISPQPASERKKQDGRR